METAGILKTPRAGAQAPLCRRLLLTVLLQLVACTAWGEMPSGGLADLTAAEQYRQFNLVLMVAEGMDPAFLAKLETDGKPQAETDAARFPQVDVDDFQTPLNRIVDQEALIASAVKVFRFVQDNRNTILSATADLAKNQPAAIAEVDLVELAEDAIIVRAALASALEYRESKDAADAAYVQAYQARTIYLRNVMEYWSFSEELASMTEDAMDSTGGRMEAYQRLLEAEPAMDSFKEHLQAMENIYWLARNKKGKPPKLPGEELIESEAEVQ